MTLQLTVSPDFSPRQTPGWYVFNTWLQRALGEAVHLELYPSFAAQRAAIRDDRVDLIYANPFDASMILRERGFRALVAPAERPDEALVVVPSGHPAADVAHLDKPLRVASTEDPAVNTICRILLEPADIGPGDLRTQTVDSYVLVAKELLRGNADLGFFLEAAFLQLSPVVTGDLRPLARSRIHVVRHVLLAGPRLAARHRELGLALSAMHREERGLGVLAGIGLTRFDPVDAEDVEFMIDLVDTLIAQPA